MLSATPIADEDRWIDSARRGDLSAFEQLYRQHVRQIYGACRRLLDSDQDAEDMTQRVFIRAWQRLAGFRGNSRLGTWLRRIAVNLIIDERRARWRQELELSADDSAQRPEETVPAPLARSSTDAIDLERAVRRLPHGPRRVLVLHDIEGYTHKEIAQMLGVVPGTTKTQLFRARRALQEILQ